MSDKFYNAFFNHFRMTEADFVEYGIEKIIFAPEDEVYDDWRQRKNCFINKSSHSNKFYIRSDKDKRWTCAYEAIFGISVKIDVTKNSKPTSALEGATNVKKKGSAYTSAHIFGRTRNFMLFSALFNICFIPDLYAPFSDTTSKKSGVHEHFRKMLLDKVRMEYGDVICEYNSFIAENHITERIESYISEISKFGNLSRADKRFVKDLREQWKEIRF